MRACVSFVCVYLCVYAYVCMYVYIHTYVCESVCVRAHTHAPSDLCFSSGFVQRRLLLLAFGLGFSLGLCERVDEKEIT